MVAHLPQSTGPQTLHHQVHAFVKYSHSLHIVSNVSLHCVVGDDIGEHADDHMAMWLSTKLARNVSQSEADWPAL